jgi:hypothetical protein
MNGERICLMWEAKPRRRLHLRALGVAGRGTLEAPIIGRLSADLHPSTFPPFPPTSKCREPPCTAASPQPPTSITLGAVKKMSPPAQNIGPQQVWLGEVMPRPGFLRRWEYMRHHQVHPLIECCAEAVSVPFVQPLRRRDDG